MLELVQFILPVSPMTCHLAPAAMIANYHESRGLQIDLCLPLLLKVFMCSCATTRVTLTPSPLTVVVLVSMNNLFHLRLLLCKPRCSNSAVRTTEPWVQPFILNLVSILYLQWPWFNIYHFIHLCGCTKELFCQRQNALISLASAIGSRLLSQPYERIASTKYLLEYTCTRVFPL